MARSAAAAIASAAAAFGAVLVLWYAAGGGGFDLPWAPTWGLRLAVELDGLAALYALLATGIALLVFVHASAYVPRHIAHEERLDRPEWRFHAAMVLFLVAMVGLATAQDLLLLFVFWDVTAVASWLLIGFDRHDLDARLSALMALLVTTISAVLMLVGILVLKQEYGTTQIPELLATAQEGTAVTVAGVLIAIAALAKSAQVPLHFWLPRAMAAPTPVSAYLHSAAMVAAGVFVLSRLHPLLAHSAALMDGLLVVGLLSMAVGSVLAFAADHLKQVLAYSTIAQYGYVVALLGVGGAAGVGAASFYVLVHALAKSALFLTVGTVSQATGAHALSETGGLARRMPLLAAGSALAAAGLAALPLTAGFFKDELLFKAAVERGTWLAILTVAAAAMTLAYTARLWTGMFLGRERGTVEHVPARMVWPVGVLGLGLLVGGVLVKPFAELASDAAAVAHAGPVDLHPAYHLDARAENVMALSAYGAGLLVLAARRVLGPVLALVQRAGAAAGPTRAYEESLVGLNRLSDRIHDIEIRDLRARVGAVIVPGAALVALGVALTPTEGAYRAGTVAGDDMALLVALAVVAVTAVAATRPRRHVGLVLSLSSVGFALAVAYVLIGAPDLALVAVLIETVFALLFVGVFARLPRDVLRQETRRRGRDRRETRDAAIAVTSAVVTTLVVWAGLSRPVPERGMAERHVALAEEAHGKDVVTVILTDFRGLDTLVEVTVVAVAMLAVATLLRGRLRP